MTSSFRHPVVVDTNVVSYIYRNDAIARPYLDILVGYRAVISFQTYEEILFGVLINNWGHRRKEEIVQYIDAAYHVVESTLDMIRICAELRAESRRRGRGLNHPDAWIAATAVLLNCPLLSHDRDFGDLPGLEVIHCEIGG